MKSLATLFAIAIAFLCQSLVPLEAAEKSLGRESLGKISLEQKAGEVMKLLGKPASMGKDTLMEATGEWVQEWKFPSHGLRLDMASGKKGGAKTVCSITGAAGCKLVTDRGIMIGSSLAAVRKAYGDVEAKDESRPGETFVAGSVFGGVIFTLKKGKVSEIFIGAAAE